MVSMCAYCKLLFACIHVLVTPASCIVDAITHMAIFLVFRVRKMKENQKKRKPDTRTINNLSSFHEGYMSFSSLFYDLDYSFHSSPLLSGLLKAFFRDLWAAKQRQGCARTYEHRNEETVELSPLRVEMQSQAVYHTYTHTHWTWCPHPGRPLYCGIVCTQSLHEWLICIFSRPSLWWWVYVWSSGKSTYRYLFSCLCAVLWCAWWCMSVLSLLRWATVDYVFPLNEAASSFPCLWETIVGSVQWKDACLGKGCKVMGKGSFVSAGSWGSESWADVFIA